MPDDAMHKQVGGSHYKDLAIQPSEYCERNALSHLQSQVVKYVTRAGKKGDEVEDLKKAIHCLEMRIQMIEEGLV